MNPASQPASGTVSRPAEAAPSARNPSGDSLRWRYRAADASGAAVRGEVEATSERDAVDTLRRRSLWVISLEPMTGSVAQTSSRSSNGVATRESLSSRWARWWGSDDVELAIMVRAMATLLGAGVPLLRALSYAAQDAGSPRWRAVFATMRDAVERGDALSEAAAAQSALPSMFPPLIAAGESSGTLSTSLALLADDLERRDALRTRIRSALVYPVILAVASTIGVLVILLVVVPRFAELISDGGGALPFSTRVLIALSGALSRGWWVIPLAFAVVAVLVERGRRDAAVRARWDERALRWPVVGPLARTRAAASYTGTLAIALRSGVPLLRAMALARAVVANRSLQRQLADAESRVHGGVTLSQALDGLLSPLAQRLLDAGEASGDIAGMASRAAEASDNTLQRIVTQTVALIEPAMILGFGGVVGFVALALLQAIYGLNASVL